MNSEYVETRSGGYYVAGTRISLESVVSAFNRGESPDQILVSFPLLQKPARVYGAIAYYLDHQAEVDAYIAEAGREFESGAVPLAELDPALWERLQRARTRMGDSRL